MLAVPREPEQRVRNSGLQPPWEPVALVTNLALGRRVSALGNGFARFQHQPRRQFLAEDAA